MGTTMRFASTFVDGHSFQLTRRPLRGQGGEEGRAGVSGAIQDSERARARARARARKEQRRAPHFWSSKELKSHAPSAMTGAGGA